MKEKTLEFKWSVSRRRDSYGYNICTLWVDGRKVTACNGGGYDMRGTSLGLWMQRAFEKELLQLKKEYYGLTFHDPNFNPAKAVIDGKTVEEREKEGTSFGLERYQAFYRASSKIPTECHTIPLLDGACGFSCMETILKDIGYYLKYISESRNRTTYLLTEYKEYKPNDHNTL